MVEFVNVLGILQQNAQVLQKSDDVQFLDLLDVDAIRLSVVRNDDDLVIALVLVFLDLPLASSLTLRIRRTSFLVCANCWVNVIKSWKYCRQ